MDLFELSATLGLDTNPYIQGLNGALTLAGKVGGAVTGLLKDAFDTGLEFDKAMAGVYAVTETIDEAEQHALSAKAIAEAAISSFTTAQVAEAEYYEGLAGYTNEEIRDSLHGLVITAEAAGESLKPISDILTDQVAAYGAAKSETEHYGDVLAAMATNANTTIVQAGNAMKYVSPLAAAVGWQIEDVALGLMLAGDQAIKGSMAGTGFRSILSRIAANAGATAKDLGALEVITEKLGVSFYDSKGNVRDFLPWLTETREAWRGLGEEDLKVVEESLQQVFGEGAIDQFLDDAKEVKKAIDLMSLTKNEDEIKQYNDTITEYYARYTDLFKELGIETTNIQDAFEQARYRFGDMTDEERIYYANRIGGLRAMSEFLTWMNADEDTFQKSVEAVYEEYGNVQGAAERMRDIRLGSNLWGDIERFKAAYDAMLTQTYQNTKNPFRAIVQDGTEAINRISEAINEGGLIGGIQQFGVEAHNFIEEYQDEIKAFAEAVVPIVTTIFNTFTPLLVEAGYKLGGAFIKGVIDAIVENPTDALPITAWLGGSSLLGGLFGGGNGGGGLGAAVGGYAAGKASGLLGNLLKYAALGVGGFFTKTLPGLFSSGWNVLSTFGTKLIAGAGIVGLGIADELLAAYDVTKLKEATDTYAATNAAFENELKTAHDLYLQRYTTDGKEAADQFAKDVYGITVNGNTLEESQESLEGRLILQWENTPKNMWDAFVMGWNDYFGENGKGIGGLLGDAWTSFTNWLTGDDENSLPSKVSKILQGYGIPSDHYFTPEEAEDSGFYGWAKRTAESIAAWFKGELPAAGQEGGAVMAQEVYDEMLAKSTDINTTLVTSLTDAGTDGGADMIANVATEVDREAPTIASDFAGDMSAVGPEIGTNLANSIGTELSSRTFSINVNANVYGLPGGPGMGRVNTMQKYASAMTGGKIIHKPTVFGYDNGKSLVAGDAGDEAVVGVNSLYSMIQKAVQSASAGEIITVPRQAEPKNLTVILEMDGREYARTTLPYFEAEKQRVGVRLATGGA